MSFSYLQMPPYYSDETVEVGAKLYEIDTEAQAAANVAVSEAHAASAEATPVAAASTETSTQHAVPATATTTDPQHHTRSPSISFLGRDGWAARLSGAEHTVPVPTQPVVPAKAHDVIVLDGSMLSSRYGRPDFSDEEMEALMLGGANVAPSVVVPSSGAVFSVASGT